MKIHLSENIRDMRRQRDLTQEQLAEQLGVSVAAVSKWERGTATPDLPNMVEMAALFGVSMDALIGHELQSETVTELEQRLRQLQREKRFEEAEEEALKAIVRYPNHFGIVYQCGYIHFLKGLERGDRAASEKAVELLRHAITLLYQNTDPVLSETTIQILIAQALLGLGREEEGVALLKKHNVYGINDALIGELYTLSDRFDPDEGFPFLVRSFVDSMEKLIRTLNGYINLFLRRHDDASALEAAQWLTAYLESLKPDAEQPSYVDKLIATYSALCACLVGRSGLNDRARACLHKAYRVASAFDRAPDYELKRIRFCLGHEGSEVISDNIGPTCVMGVEQAVLTEEGTEEIRQYWEELKRGRLSL